MRTLALERAADGVRRDRPPAARIGPNAIIQLGIAAANRLGEEARRDLFCRAGVGRYLDAPPEAMVEEADVIALHRALRAVTAPAVYRLVAWEAGLLTGDYILAHRIPKPAQIVLRLMPKRFAAKALTAAIGKHAWTFAGSGVFRAVSTRPIVLEIAESPLCRGAHAADPLCDYYAGTFTRLYRRPVDPRITMVETHCGAVDGATCRFEEAAAGSPGPHAAGHPAA